MKKFFAVFLSVHLALFASFYYVKSSYSAPVEIAEEISYAPDENLVLAGRFENMLNHLSGQTSHKVDNYTLNSDGTYTVFTSIDTEEGKQHAVSLFAPDDQSNFGYELLYCDIITENSLTSI